MEICLTAVLAETRRPRVIYYLLFPLVLKHYVKICTAVPAFVATHVFLRIKLQEVAVFEGSNVRYKIGLLYRKGLHSNIATLVLRKPIYDTVFCIQMFCVLCSKLVTSVF